MKKFLILSLVLLWVLVAAIPAAADKPEEYYDITYEELMVVAYCDGFDALVRSDVHEVAVDYFDHEANWIRSRVELDGIDHLVKSTAPDVVIATGDFRITLHVDVISPPPALVTEVKFTGTALNIHLPGGVALHVAGQQTLWVEGDPAEPTKETLVKSVGVIDWDEAEICAALVN